MIGACGSGASPAPPTQAPTAAPTQGAVGGNLDFLSWEGYDLPDIMTSWLGTNAVTLVPTYPSNHDEIQAKLLGGGGGGIDIYTYYQGYKDFYTQLEIMTPIDESRIPNLSGVFDFFKSDVGNYWINSAGQRTGVPWTWSINALTYDSARVAEPTSYHELLDPKNSGRITVADDPLGAFTIGALIFGYDVTTLTPAQQTEVAEFLGDVLGQAKTVSPSYGDATTLLTSG
jgi:spermidine/putrescine-binding protein